MTAIGPYYTWYSSRSRVSYPIQPTQIESGMLLDVFYASKNKPEEKSKISVARKYIILVLHPRWISENGKDYFLHALTLEYIKGPDFYKFTEDIGLSYAENFKKIKKLRVPKFDMRKEEAKKFYLTEVKIRMLNKRQSLSTLDFSLNIFPPFLEKYNNIIFQIFPY